MSSINWTVEKKDGIYIYLKKIPFLGWFAKIQRPPNLNIKTINFIKSKYHPFKIIVEPLHNNLNLKPSKEIYLPTKTLQINLSKSKSEILKNMHQKTRYNIRLSIKKQIKIEKSTDISEFTNFWRQHFEKKRFPFFSQSKNIEALYQAFGKDAHILFAYKGQEPIGSLFILIHGEAAYYMYAAVNSEGRKSFAPTLLTWESILLAKKSGCKIFDFDGVYDTRFPVKSWLGFTRFKSGFGGIEVEYPGSFKV